MGQQASDMQGSFGGAVPVYRKRVTRLVNHLNPEAGRDVQHLSLENTAAPLPQLENVKSERHGRVAVLTLTREKALNALCDALVADLNVCLNACVADGNIGCIVLTGAGRAFCFFFFFFFFFFVFFFFFFVFFFFFFFFFVFFLVLCSILLFFFFSFSPLFSILCSLLLFLF